MLFEDVFLVEIQDAKSTTKHRPQKVFESGSHISFLPALPFRFWLQAPKWRPLKTEGYGPVTLYGRLMLHVVL